MEPEPTHREESLFLGLLFVCSIAFFLGLAAFVGPVFVLALLLYALGLISADFIGNATFVILLLGVFAGIWLSWKAGKESYENHVMWKRLRKERDA